MDELELLKSLDKKVPFFDQQGDSIVEFDVDDALD